MGLQRRFELQANIFISPVLKLSQHVEHPNPATVLGEGEVVLEYSEYNKASYSDATIEVQKAIA